MDIIVDFFTDLLLLSKALYIQGIIALIILVIIKIGKANERTNINALKSRILDIQQEMKHYEEELSDKRRIADLLNLINSCDADISAIYNNPKYNNIKQLTDEIESRKKIIRVLSDEIQNKR